jgi:sugar phosphate isomerase/epimerase
MPFTYKLEEYAFSTWTLIEYPLTTALDMLHQNGFDNVEIWASVQHMDPRLNVDLRTVCKCLKQNHQRVHSLHSPILHPFRHPEDADDFRAYRMDLHRRTLDVCEAVGAQIMVVHPYDSVYYPYLANQAQIIRDSIGKLTEYAKKCGVKIAVENMPEKVKSGHYNTSLIRQKETFADLDVYYCLDIGHVPILGENTCEEEIDAVADRLVTLHVHNNDGQTDEHRLPNDGILDWPVIHDYARAKGYQGEFVLELRGEENALDVMHQATALFR